MLVIIREPIMSAAEAGRLEGTEPQPSHIKEVFCAESGPVQVINPWGKTLLTYVPGCLPLDVCAAAYEPLIQMANRPVAGGNRGSAAGVAMAPQKLVDGSEGKRMRVPELEDMSDIDRERLQGAMNNVIGSLDRRPDVPRCRQTDYNAGHPLVQPCLPLFHGMDVMFAKYDPDSHAFQQMMADRTLPEYVIPRTASTTVTINRNWTTFYHTDDGDLDGGRTVMTVLRGGTYSGCLFTVVEYSIAVDVGSQDVLICDTHNLWHGNTPIVGEPGTYERLSVVLYYRQNMHNCLGAEGELHFHRHRKLGDPLYPGKNHGRTK
jgi:2-oxoglutarate-Fe(II)-dependent dioxygenase family protein